MGLTVRFASTLVNSNIVIVCGRCAYGPLYPNEDDAYFSGFKTFTELFSIHLVIQLPTCCHLATFIICHIWDIQTGQVHMTWGDLPPWMRTVHWVWPTTTERQTAVLCKASQMTPYWGKCFTSGFLITDFKPFSSAKVACHVLSHKDKWGVNFVHKQMHKQRHCTWWCWIYLLLSPLLAFPKWKDSKCYQFLPVLTDKVFEPSCSAKLEWERLLSWCLLSNPNSLFFLLLGLHTTHSVLYVFCQ